MSEEADIRSKIAYVDEYIAKNSYDDLAVKYFVDILNYICELENNFSKQRNLYKELQTDTINLQQRIDKVIEFIQNGRDGKGQSYVDFVRYVTVDDDKKLLSILKGEDK